MHPRQADPFEVFTAHALVQREQATGPVEASACRLAFPS
jgi:hypothetical protein